MQKILLLSLVLLLSTPFLSQAQDFSITIDAQKDAWYSALTGPENGLVFMPAACYLRDVGTAPDNDTDLSAVLWLCYDENYLYLYGEFKDDVVTASNAQRYLNDCIELKFDPDPASGAGTATSNLRLTARGADTAEDPAGVDNLNGSGHLVDPGGTAYIPEEDDYARRLTADGYALEFRVPFEYINEPEDDRFMVRGEGQIFGLAINIGDNDSGTRDHMLQWSAGHTDAAHSNAVHHGKVTYMPGHVLKLEAVSPRDATVVNDNAAVWYANPFPVGVKTDPILVESFELSNYPNPFNPQTTIRYHLNRAENVTLAVYDVNGALIRQLVAELQQSPGSYDIVWDGRHESGQAVSSGAYFCRLATPTRVVSAKMLLLK